MKVQSAASVKFMFAECVSAANVMDILFVFRRTSYHNFLMQKSD